MKELKIAFFVWEYPPRIVGGLGTFAEYVCPEMVKFGHDVSLFTLNEDKNPLKTREVLGGVEVHRPFIVPIEDTLPLYMTEDLKRWHRVELFADIHTYNIISASKLINDLIKKEGYNFHVDVANDWLSAEAGIIVKKKTKLPFVFHVHSTESGRTMGHSSETIVQLEKKAMEQADRVITVSYPMQQELIKQGIPAEKISVCWNGVDPERYNMKNVKEVEVQRIRKRYDIGSQEKMILFVGRAVPIKGIIELISAMSFVIKSHPEAKLVALTTGGLEGTIQAMINRLGLSNNVKPRFEFVSEDERILHYAACDLAVLPSHYEPFGIVSLEAMSMGKPVVVGCQGTCGFRDQVTASGPEQTGFHVNGKKPEDIAEWGIIPALDDPEKSREMGKKGRKRVEKYFTWKQATKSILDVYKEVIEAKK